MNIVAFTPPGRFPTVVHDPGEWWNALAGVEGFRATRVSTNYRWWRVLCGPTVADIFAQTRVRRFIHKFQSNPLRGSAIAAGYALTELSDPATYKSVSSYIKAITPIANHLDKLNTAQGELQFSFEIGVSVITLNYYDSQSLLDYSRSKTLLSELIAASLADFTQDVELLVVTVTFPQDLLCAMTAVEQLRKTRPAIHVCLADHGYENFSLTPFLATLRTAGTLDTIFDTIIESKDERDTILPLLARALARGETPRGFLRREHLGSGEERKTIEVSRPDVAPPPVPTFASEPIFCMRLSSRRCYWGRCTYCVQNAKYEATSTPSITEVSAALDRIGALVVSGYKSLILSDEAVSPAILGAFSRGLLARGLQLRWNCRCKLERVFTPELFNLMYAAGCPQILFGLDSISPRILRLMDKYVEGLDPEGIHGIIRAADKAGIGIHISLIAGFPGETPEETNATVDFVIRSLRQVADGSFTLNYFTLFRGIPVMTNAAAFGIVPEESDDDMAWSYRYRFAPGFEANGQAVERLLPGLLMRLIDGLGWNRFVTDRASWAAIKLYFLSGHRFSAVFRRQSCEDPEDESLSPTLPMEGSCQVQSS